jgi:hypothetical protein
MSCEDDANTISEAINAALAGPKRVKGDAGEVEQHSIGDLIRADQYARSKCAASSPRRGIRFSKIVPPGLD